VARRMWIVVILSRIVLVGFAIGVTAAVGRLMGLNPAAPSPIYSVVLALRRLAAAGCILTLLLIWPQQITGQTLDTKGGSSAPSTPLHTVRVGVNPAIVAVDPPDRRVFTVNEGPLVADKLGETLLPAASGSVTVLDVATGRVLRTAPVGRNPVAAVVDAPAKRLVVLNAGRIDTSAGVTNVGGSVTLLDAVTGAVARTVVVGALPVTLSARGSYPVAPQALAVDPLTGRVFVVVPAGLLVLDGATGHVRQRIALDGAPSLVAVDASARRVYVGNAYDDALASNTSATADVSHASLAVLDLATGRAIANVALTQDHVSALAVDRRVGRVVAVGLTGNSAACGVAELLDARTGAHLVTTPLAPPRAYRNGECVAGVDGVTSRAFVLYTAGSYDLGRTTAIGVSTLDTRNGRFGGTVDVNATGGEFLNRAVAVDERDSRVFAFAAEGDYGVVKGSLARVLDARTGQTLSSPRVSTGPQDAAVDETARRLFVTNGRANTLDVFDASRL